jgi:hypothetical protein
MPHPQDDAREIARRGEEIYERDLKEQLEPAHTGKFLVIDIDTGDSELDTDEVAAFQRVMARNPDGRRYLKRIGFPVTHRLGGRMRVGKP